MSGLKLHTIRGGIKMEYHKITKKEFIDHAVNDGIALLGAKGCDLDEAINIVKNAKIDLNIPRIKCTVSGQHLKRGTSNLRLDKNDTIYKAGDFYVIHSFTPAGNGCNFKSNNCIFYI
jgi:hypothetical protein